MGKERRQSGQLKPHESRGAETELKQPLAARVAAYALAAGAAGLGIVAGAQSAEAQVVYTPVHIVINPGTSYDLELNNNGIPDFKLVNGKSGLFGQPALSIQSGHSGFANQVEVLNGCFEPAALGAGAKIGASQNFEMCTFSSVPFEFLVVAETQRNSFYGAWANVRKQYLGLQFLLNGRTHYGWARLSVVAHGSKIEALLTGYAYQAAPNEPITAGQTHGAADEFADPDASLDPTSGSQPISQNGLQPVSLGLLALGAPGLDIWRPSARELTQQ